MASHNAGSRKRPRRRIMRALKINEISAVDVPAQEGAVALLLKRHSQTDEIEKGAALTTENAGNTHLVSLVGHNGDEVNSGMTSWVDEHSHPWIRTEEDDIVIGATPASDGEVHAHEIAQMSKLDAEKRTFTAEQRRQLAKEGKALPDGSFPIVTKGDLRNAISAFGRSSNKAQVARHIKKRARALGATDMLPTEGRLADLLKGEETTMTDKTQKDEPTVEGLQAQLARANSIATLNDAEKAHFGTIKGDGADAFLAKSADERKAIVEKVAKGKADAEAEKLRKANEANPVVYKTTEGIEVRKSDGDVVLALAKSNDKLQADNSKLSGAAEDASYEKRAETELKHMPGNVATRAAMLRAVDGIEDEAQRKSAHDSLKAQNTAMSKAFDTIGQGGTPAPGSPDEELENLAKAHQKDHSDLTYEQAYAAITKTERGGELYAKTIN